MTSGKLFWRALLCIIGCCALVVSYAGLEPATQLAFQSKNISGIGKVYQIATMEGSIYIATGQPTQAGLKQLRKLKVKTVINLLPQHEALSYDEAAAVKKLGINYAHVPIDIANFSMDTIKQFNKAIYAPKNYPLFIHCNTGNRVAMMMAFNNITQHRVPAKIAIDEAKNYGLTNPQYIQFIEKTVRRYNLGKK